MPREIKLPVNILNNRTEAIKKGRITNQIVQNYKSEIAIVKALKISSKTNL